MNKIGLLAALMLLASWPLHAQHTGVSAELVLDQDEYLPNEDVQLKVRVTNRSGQTITLGADTDWINLAVVREDKLPCNPLGIMPPPGASPLASGEVGTLILHPTPYFDFRRNGRYHIKASIKIPEWQSEMPCKSVAFTVGNGVPLLNYANLEIGMPLPPGVSNTIPEVRKYSLLRVGFIKGMELYFRLTDSHGKVLRVFPIARMTSFSDPEAQIDRDNNFHVLHQTGARTFNYAVINPEGELVARQTYVYTDSRPKLRVSQDGRVFVSHGARRMATNDFPPPAAETEKRQ